MGRTQLLMLVLTILAIVAAAWFIKAGHWRRGRLTLVTVGILAALALLSRRVGVAELVILAVLVLVPALLVAPRRPRAAPRREPPRQA